MNVFFCVAVKTEVSLTFSCNILRRLHQTTLIPIKNTFIDKMSRNLSSKMTSWEAEKLKYLNMDIVEKRKFYEDPTVPLAEIPTWKDYCLKNVNLKKKVDRLPKCKIDESKNSLLADKVSLITGDITKLEVEAIVNAANKSLLGGMGVDGAIHKVAGPLLKQECQTLHGCETGEAKITGAYKLAAKYVIHTAGPQGEIPDLLRNCYNNSLELVLQNNLRTIAFPCISTGIYGYPGVAAAHIAAYTVRKFLEEHAQAMDRVVFCVFLQKDSETYEGIMQSYFPVL